MRNKPVGFKYFVIKGKKKMRTKKTATKKPVAKKATAKTGTANIKLLSATSIAKGAGTRRPPNNPDVPQAAIDQINAVLNGLKTLLDDYAQHLRSLDRRRLNGVGVKKPVSSPIQTTKYFICDSINKKHMCRGIC
jgi:hypothetical protein